MARPPPPKNRISGEKLKPLAHLIPLLDRIVDAHRHMESNTQMGKIVVTT